MDPMERWNTFFFVVVVVVAASLFVYFLEGRCFDPLHCHLEQSQLVLQIFTV